MVLFVQTATGDGTALPRVVGRVVELPGMPWLIGLFAAVSLLQPYLPSGGEAE